MKFSKVLLIGGATVVLTVVAVLVYLSTGPGLFDTSHLAINIERYHGDDEIEPVDEQALQQEVPGLAAVLDEMIRENLTEDPGIDPSEETINEWCAFLDSQMNDCLSPFEYRGVAFLIFLIGT